MKSFCSSKVTTGGVKIQATGWEKTEFAITVSRKAAVPRRYFNSLQIRRKTQRTQQEKTDKILQQAPRSRGDQAARGRHPRAAARPQSGWSGAGRRSRPESVRGRGARTTAGTRARRTGSHNGLVSTTEAPHSHTLRHSTAASAREPDPGLAPPCGTVCARTFAAALPAAVSAEARPPPARRTNEGTNAERSREDPATYSRSCTGRRRTSINLSKGVRARTSNRCGRHSPRVRKREPPPRH